jgi:Relaxase/Mobilisation nuclease domain
MAVLKFNATPNQRAAKKHMEYITRERACESLSFHNLPELENRADAIAHAERRMEEEAAKPPPRNGSENRSHYRLLLSYEREISTEQAREQAHQFLQENFPNARAAVAIHRDSGNTHAHCFIDSLSTERGQRGQEKKLQIGGKQFHNLDQRWAQQADRLFGTDRAREFQQKKEETRRAKQERQPRPARARDGMTSDRWREKDLRDSGVNHEPNESRPDRDQRFDTAGQRPLAESERAVTDAGRAIDSRADTVERTEQGIGGLAGAAAAAVRAVEETSREAESLRDRLSDMDRERGLTHDRDDDDRGRGR